MIGRAYARLFHRQTRRGDPCGRPHQEVLNTEHSKRKVMRLQKYNYAEDVPYFITVCTDNRKCILSELAEPVPGSIQLHLTELGNVAETTLLELAENYGFLIYTYVIMPNHVHILISPGKSGMTVGRYIGAWKSLVANRWVKICTAEGKIMGKLWQRDFYDHIIRNEADFAEKWEYIRANPYKWHEDTLYIK